MYTPRKVPLRSRPLKSRLEWRNYPSRLIGMGVWWRPWFGATKLSWCVIPLRIGLIVDQACITSTRTFPCRLDAHLFQYSLCYEESSSQVIGIFLIHKNSLYRNSAKRCPSASISRPSICIKKIQVTTISQLRAHLLIPTHSLLVCLINQSQRSKNNIQVSRQVSVETDRVVGLASKALRKYG